MLNDDYIKRSGALKAVCETCSEHKEEGDPCDSGCGDYALIEQIPAADVKKLYTANEVATLLAETIGDDCACNVNGNDEWLPYHCDFRDTVCPNPCGVACWEQYLKYLDKKPKEEDSGNEL